MRATKVATTLGLLLASTTSVAVEAMFTDQQICRAAIATIMHKDVSIVSASGTGVIFVSYSSDGPKKFKCRLEGPPVMWGNADGRWRNHSLDEKVMWEAIGDTLVIRQPWSDGSLTEDEFNKNQL